MAYIENPIVAGKDFESVLEDVNGNFGELSGLQDFSRQKPWDINENVDRIQVNDTKTFTVYGYGYTGGDNRISINMINSGKLYLCFNVFRHSGAFVERIDISVNDEIVASLTSDDVSESSKTYTFFKLIEVVKGDIVSITTYGTHDDTRGYINVSNIILKANIDTAYKYINLPITTSVKTLET